jgi:hypothetical protein
MDNNISLKIKKILEKQILWEEQFGDGVIKSRQMSQYFDGL